jgi:elongation factor P
MASSIQATRLRKGNLIKLGNDLFRLMEVHHLTPGNKRAHIQARMRNIRTGTLADHKFRAEEDVERAVLDEREMQYLYNDGDHYYFMDTSTYEQIHVGPPALGDATNYIVDGSTMVLQFYKDEIIGTDLPAAVELQVTDTEPGLQGDRVSGARKPATLETGLVVQVPLFVNQGERIKVDTRSAEYLTRA